MANLEDIVKQLTNPAPRFEDPEEDEGDVTRARVTAQTVDGDDDLDFDATELRRRAGLDTLEDDAKYKGERASRKDLYEADEGDDSGAEEDGTDEEIDSDEAGNPSDADDQDGGSVHEEESGASDAEGNEEDREGTGGESDEEIVSDDEESIEDGENDEERADDVGGVRQFSAVSQEDEVAKGKAVVAQLELWDHLMEGRIKLQKVLTTVNGLPKPETMQQLTEAGGPDQEKLMEVRAQLQSLLSLLLQLQATLLLGNPATKSIASTTPSDPSPQNSSKRELDEEEGEVKSAKRFASFQTYRNNTLEKWDNNTRLSSKLKSFSAFNTSVLKQIDQVISDKDRLVKRTQVNRAVKSGDNREEAAYDSEVFNDDDFYHILLRELIERKNDSSDTTDITRQWLEIQKMRSSVKRKTVDTRASKGRRLRYNIHKKMVNFMAPVDTSTWSTEAKNDLFKSLFKGSSVVEV